MIMRTHLSNFAESAVRSRHSCRRRSQNIPRKSALRRGFFVSERNVSDCWTNARVQRPSPLLRGVTNPSIYSSIINIMDVSNKNGADVSRTPEETPQPCSKGSAAESSINKTTLSVSQSPPAHKQPRPLDTRPSSTSLGVVRTEIHIIGPEINGTLTQTSFYSWTQGRDHTNPNTLNAQGAESAAQSNTPPITLILGSASYDDETNS